MKTKPGVNLIRPTSYKPKPYSPPVCLDRPPGYKNQRKPFIDPMELSYATLAGPHALRQLIVDADTEINKIREEIHAMTKKHLPTPHGYSVTLDQCQKSPFGLCAIKKTLIDNSGFDRCIFCSAIV